MGRQGGLVVAVECEVPEQADQIVGHYDEVEGGFRSPKVLQTERVESEVLLEFLNAILAVGPGVVDIPDLVQWQVQVGHAQAEAVVGPARFELTTSCTPFK
jgi:hypothetical protein